MSNAHKARFAWGKTQSTGHPAFSAQGPLQWLDSQRSRPQKGASLSGLDLPLLQRPLGFDEQYEQRSNQARGRQHGCSARRDGSQPWDGGRDDAPSSIVSSSYSADLHASMPPSTL